MSTDNPLDRTSNPELTGLFDALEELAAPPTDPALRAAQIGRASAIAREAGAATVVSPITWRWRRSVSWRVAAVAAATTAIVAGLGADDRLPEPAQRVVSSVADAVGLDVPDGSDRDASSDGADDGTVGQSGTTPAVPADPGGPGEPAIPATPASPGRGDGPSNDNSNRPDEPPRAEPATPADPGGPGQPATPATPATPSPGNGPDNGNGNGNGQNNRPDEPPAGDKADPKGKAKGQSEGDE